MLVFLSTGFGAGKVTGTFITHGSSCMKMMILNGVWPAAIDYGDEAGQMARIHYLTMTKNNNVSAEKNYTEV